MLYKDLRRYAIAMRSHRSALSPGDLTRFQKSDSGRGEGQTDWSR